MTWNVLKKLFNNKPIALHAALATLLVLGCTGLISGPNNPVQRWLYDLSQRHATYNPADSAVVIVAIDEDSKAKLGEWPWANSLHAGLLEQLRTANTRTAAFSAPLQTSSPDDSSNDIKADLQLEQAIKAYGRLVLPLEVSIRPGNDSSDRQLTSLLNRTQRHFGDGSLEDAVPARPITNVGNKLLTAAAGVGHVISPVDSDRVTRREYAAVKLDQLALPALSVALSNLATEQRNALIVTNDQLQLNAQRDAIALRPDLSFAPHYPTSGFTTISYWQVLTGEFDRELLRDKVVLVGFTDGANADRVETAVGSWPRVAVIAAATASLLQGDTYHHPAWAALLEILVGIGVIALCTLSFIRFNNKYKYLIFMASAVTLLAVDYWALSSASVTLNLVPQTVALLAYLGFSWALGNRSPQANAGSPAISMDTLKTLALTLHGQGQLDLAYETLRRCQPNQDTLDLTYRLAADYERRRDILKAAQVYRYISECDPHYKDAGDKVVRLQELIERPKPPATSASKPLRNISKPKPVEAPAVRTSSKETLGRYEIERQIGKGAMGVVYLGRDPKINRVVAIKAIPLAEEFEDHDLVEARERFFREAEMAGRLNHPGIVTIFDAGEDHGLAYIAMEYIKGEHLSYYCEQNRLLPIKKALTLIIRVAEALNYAHLQNVVHRDIKPANIMFNIDTDALKITDFGIARLSDVSRTKTGIVLGTPSFMSPEQLEGRPLDGRSDLFALGVTLYQLLTGQLPFRADSMTRLMNNIATEPHPPIRSLRPELPACLESIIDRCLAKPAEDRFQNGVDMAEALRNCMRTMTP